MTQEPDLSQARAFLASLLNCTPEDAAHRFVTWQTFDDVKPSGKARGELARLFHGSLVTLAGDLEALSRKGAGIFVTVCGGDGKGRRKANMKTARAWWCDLDTKDARAALDLARVPLSPSMVVKTPGGWHLYWLAEVPEPFLDDALRLEHEAEVRRIAQALEAFGGDLKACDVARVLRVPGFLHRKAEPRLVTLESCQGSRYTRAQIQAAFPPLEEKPKQAMEARSAGMVRPAPPGRAGLLKRAVRYLGTLPPAISGQGGHHGTFNAALKLTTGFDLTEDEALSLLVEHFNPRCEPPWNLEDLRHKVLDAWHSAQRSPNRGHLLDQSHNRDQGTSWAGPKAVQSSKGVDPIHTLDSIEDDPSIPQVADIAPPEVPGFRWRESGLFQTKLKASRDGEEPGTEEAWIAPPFTLPGLVRDEDSHGWRLLIAWKDLDEMPHEEAVAFDLLSGEGAELARTLGQGGFLIHPDLTRRKALLRYLSAAAPKVRRRVRVVEALGWHGSAFVLPGGECIGTTDEPLRYGGESAGGVLQGQRGTLEGWQEGVAHFAVRNPRLSDAANDLRG